MIAVVNAGSVRRSLAGRLVAVVLMALAGMLAVVALVFLRASDVARVQGLESALAHYRQQAERVELEWRVQAEALRAQIEFMRLLDEPQSARRAASLTAFMASFGGSGAFTHAQVLDMTGRVLASYYTRSRQDLPVPPVEAGAASWVFGEEDRLAYRAFSLPVTLGDQRGRLLLFAPLDQALLQRFAFPSTQVVVRLGTQEVLASRAERPAPAGLLERLHRSAQSGELRWSDEAGAPTMTVTRTALVPLSLFETLMIVAASGLFVALLGWLVLGRWLAQQMARLHGVREASEAFAGSQQVSPAVSAAIGVATADRSDEIAQLAHAIESMMQAVVRAKEELNASRAQLANLNASLEERVLDRTRELAAARDEALSAVRAKEAFLANMSHEIRTPMNGMLGALELLGRTALDESQRRLLDTSATSGEALMAILNDVLEYSKSESQHLQLAEAPFAPAEVASAAVRLFSAAAARKGVALHLELPDDLPSAVKGDAARLRQVLLNLIGNAIKFTDRGDVRLRLRAEPPHNGGVRLHFEVSDSGIGIEPQMQAAIFEPFVQADAGRHRMHGGTGLGLSISRSLVAAMGGELTVASRPGAGSVFRFTLTLAPAVLPTAPRRSSATGLELLQGRVLLVDDQPVNRLIAAEMLRMIGLGVDECGDGQEAVERLRSERFDLVLMDNQMPVLDGLSATRQIRADELATARPRTPIIGLTANALDGDADLNLQAGMDGYLAKPISINQLHATLARWLGASYD